MKAISDLGRPWLVDVPSAGDAVVSNGSHDARMERAAHQFEASLMQELFKPLQSDPLSPAEDKESDSSNALGSFAGEAMARAVSDRGGFGIARQLIEHFNALDRK